MRGKAVVKHFVLLLPAVFLLLVFWAESASAQAAGEETDSEETASTIELDAEELSIIVERAVSKRVRPLERELKDLKNEIRFHDILGGIGYIVGAMGIAFYFLGVLRKEKRAKKED